MMDHDEFENEFESEVSFDRLVDGELSPDQYRQLLASLDNRPEDWRRLALAFLEAQAWGNELREVRQEVLRQEVLRQEVLRQEAEPRSSAIRSRPSVAWIPLSLTAAASFLAAFCLGLLWNTTSGEPVRQPVVQTVLPTGQSPPDAPNGLDQPQRGSSAADPWGRMTLVMDRDDGSSEEFEVPVFRWDDAQADRKFANSMTVPDKLRQALERAGYQIKRDIRWTPLQAAGGRRVFVPLGEVEITPVGNRAY